MDAMADAGAVGVLAPFQSRAFLWLWVGVVLSSVGSWAQTVGAQWLFINDPNAATIVSLVQTAATLPMVLFSLAAGVLSDAFDRRRLLLWVQVYFVVVAGLLSVLTAIGQMPPLLLLAFTFAIGLGNARDGLDLAAADHRTGAALAPRAGDPARHGQRQRGPRGRPGDRRRA